jgi:uncharacterized protein (DUF1810 family)
MSLQRFLDAQEPVIDTVVAELRSGRKRSHWMWFVFPQLKALGRSGTAKFYGIEGLAEAREYFAHPVLGPRLLACTEAVLRHAGKTANAIFGSPDDLKFRSCMTLFSRAAPDQPLFRDALLAFYGAEDPLTAELLDA